MITFGTGQQPERALAAFLCLPDALMMVLDEAGRAIALSDGLAVLLGLSAETSGSSALIPPWHDADRTLVEQRLADARARRGETVRFAARLRKSDGQYIALAWSGIATGEDGWVALNAHEVGLTLAENGELPEAVRDRLTGLPTRALFLDRLEHAIERARRNPKLKFAVVSLGLDRFHLINHRFGYWAGDVLLAEFAQRLRRAVRPADMVSRLGGDEFVVLLEDIRDALSPLRVIERWRRQVTMAFPVAGTSVQLSFSAGVALHRGGEIQETPEQLLADAQLAMRQAKAQGGAGAQLANRAMHVEVMRRLEVEDALERAIAQGQLEPYYQPIVHLADRRLAGFEVLVRWNHPERGLVPPLEFIPVAEESGQIVRIGAVVLEMALSQFKRWQGLPGGRALFLAVNVSPRQLTGGDFATKLQALVAQHGVDPSCLEVEITESAVLDERSGAFTVIQQLHEKGFAVVLDDFGTGYSSLSYLHRLPARAIKIDRSFVAAASASARDADFVRGIVEGVENAAQHALLQAMGAEFGQGFWYGRPVTADQATALWLSEAADTLPVLPVPAR